MERQESVSSSSSEIDDAPPDAALVQAVGMYAHLHRKYRRRRDRSRARIRELEELLREGVNAGEANANVAAADINRITEEKNLLDRQFEALNSLFKRAISFFAMLLLAVAGLFWKIDEVLKIVDGRTLTTTIAVIVVVSVGLTLKKVPSDSADD